MESTRSSSNKWTKTLFWDYLHCIANFCLTFFKKPSKKQSFLTTTNAQNNFWTFFQCETLEKTVEMKLLKTFYPCLQKLSDLRNSFSWILFGVIPLKTEFAWFPMRFCLKNSGTATWIYVIPSSTFCGTAGFITVIHIIYVIFHLVWFVTDNLSCCYDSNYLKIIAKINTKPVRNERYWNALLIAGFLAFEHCTGCHLHVQLRKQKVSRTIMTYTVTHRTFW